MAEIVEYRVGKTLAELNLLVEFGLFSKQHANEIKKKREDFEYTLRRKTRTKLDFLKYIRYEVNLLEAIDKYRKVVINENSKPKEGESKDEEIERKILLLQAKKLNDVIRARCAHISSLFRKLTTTYQFDKTLWLAYIDFAKSRKWNTRVTALYWRLLRVCSNDPDLWIAAASHEIQINKAFDTARGLYLRSLRHHPKCCKLWVEYFKMELQFMSLVDQRARIVFKTLQGLKEDSGKNSDEASIWDEDPNKNQDPAEVSPEMSNHEEIDDDNIETKQIEQDDKLPKFKAVDDDDSILSGKLPIIIYQNATDSLEAQDFYQFVIRVLSYIRVSRLESKGSLAVNDFIIADLKSRYHEEKDNSIFKQLADGCDNEVFLKEALENLENGDKDKISTKRLKPAKPSNLEVLYDCYESKGLESARQLYKDLVRSPATRTLSLFVGMIQIEHWQLPRGTEKASKPQLDNIRNIYEEALIKFGKTKTKLWYEYLQLEFDNAKSLDDFERVNQIYTRAQATLEPSKVGKLIEKYTLIQVRSDDNEIEYSDYSDLED